jgi:GntR family transcriptional regulator
MGLPSRRPRNLARRPGLTLYGAVREAIERLITDSQLKAGDALPTEAELQERFGVSRATVRQALAELDRAGVVERRQGRGTFVALPAMERELPELTGFTEHLQSRGMRASSRLVDCSVAIAEKGSDSGHFPVGTPLFKARRVRYANDFAVGVHTVYVPLAMAERIGFTEEVLRRDERASLYALMTRAGIRLTWAEEHLRARAADREESQLLGVRPGTPVMSVLRKTHDDAGDLVEVVRAVYLGDKYDYVVHLDRLAGRAGAGGLVTAMTSNSEEERK